MRKSFIVLIALALLVCIVKAISEEELEFLVDRVIEQYEQDEDMDSKLTHSQAYSKISSAGIGISSSGGCSNRNNPSCTSLEGVNQCTIDNILTLKRASGCSITITGGTEVGHAGGAKSHSSGHKLDIKLDSCINNYITTKFSYGGLRSDGAATYVAASGNRYYKEGNHWDIVFC